MLVPQCFLVAIACCLSGVSDDAADSTIEFTARYRTETSVDSGRWHTLTQAKKWKASETAIVVCDMWDRHWCPNATARVGEMAPVMNRVIAEARRRGVLIIHCPSGTLDFYKDTPQRKLAQAAPKVDTQIPLKTWCHPDPAKEGATLPIDDSDGGCDCGVEIESYRAWSRQHPAIEIADQDAITDNAEAFYLMKQKGISNVIVMGVHTNMCVLGRPFSIRQMVAQGQNVVLMRDMTDAMYNPQMAPYVSHFTGTELVVEHIEKHWCPTMLSSDLIGGGEFRFSQDGRRHVVVLSAEREYRTNETLPKFAKEHLGNDYRVSFVWDDDEDRNSLPGIEQVADADLLIVSVRRRTLPAEQLQYVRDHILQARPVIGIRTASHAFCLRNKPAPDGKDDWPEFDQAVFGGNYTNHHGSGPRTTLSAALTPEAQEVTSGIEFSHFAGHGSLYRVSPLAKSTTPVVLGTIPGQKQEPVAWINRRSDGGLSFYTSLGHIADFQQPGFNRLLRNAIAVLLKGS